MANFCEGKQSGYLESPASAADPGSRSALHGRPTGRQRREAVLRTIVSAVLAAALFSQLELEADSRALPGVELHVRE